MSQPMLFRTPSSEDGDAVFSLIEQCPPLDVNSRYCNLLQCSHFAQTSVVAENVQGMMGFISGYLLPQDPRTLFIWQVAVSEQARGQGLAKRMLKAIVERESCRAVSHMETTITEDNAASWALFESFARDRGATLDRELMFDRENHFAGAHDTEMLARIGPLHKAPVAMAG